MTDEQIECAVWLMMEYESHFDKLNAQGLATLLFLRSDWNIDKAKEVMLGDVDQ